MTDEIISEIEKLKLRKIELTNRLNLTRDYENKEEIKEEIARIAKQIGVLEGYKKRLQLNSR